MKISDLSNTATDQLASMWLAQPGRRDEWAAKFSTTVPSIERYLQFYRHFKSKREREEQDNLLAFFSDEPQPASPTNDLAGILTQPAPSVPEYPPSPSPEWTDYLEIDCDNAIIIADVELPDYDAQLMRAAHAVAQRYNIRTLIIGGDYAALDSVSAWKEVYRAGGSLQLRQELRFAETVLDTSLKWFDDVYAIYGNHEWRMGRATDGELDPFDVIRTKNGEVQVRPYDYLYMNTSRGRVMVMHPGNYSKNPLSVPQAILNTEEPRCHILSTHTHHSASGWDASGRYELMEIGCLRDPDRTQYKRQHKRKYPEWVQGFAVIKDGYRHRLTKLGTDWRAWLGDGLYAEVFGDALEAAA